MEGEVNEATPIHSYSGNFKFSSSDDDGDDYDDLISTSEQTPKLYDRFYDSTSSSDQDSKFDEAAQKRLDYMIQYLDRRLVDPTTNQTNLATTNPHQDSLPEFVARGGGDGIFKLPIRNSSTRPSCLELRPHPLRETQVGRFLRNVNVVNDGRQLWAGSECGVRVFQLKDMYDDDDEDEEGSAPYYESVECSPTLCLVGDDGHKVVWSGHRDGRIRCWKMDVNLNGFSEHLSWQAHRGVSVLSMVITSYGDLWTGSEGGALKIWPWEAIEKSLMVTVEERHMSALLIERAYIDLRSQVTLNGPGCGIFASDVKHMFSDRCGGRVWTANYISYALWAYIDLRSQVTLNGPGCGIFASDVKHMFSDRCGGRVWTANYISYALWDARTKELLKMFNIDGIIENMSTIQGPILEDEVRMKAASVSKKEKTQISVGFFQRSRNAILGAADAVRRAATKGAFGDDNRRIEALVATVDGSIWSGCANGLLILWDGNGNRLQDFQYHYSIVQCMCTYGSRIWVGYASGLVQVLDLNGNFLGEWVAHNSPVVDLTIGSGYVFTLANHGGIRGWNIGSPGPLDGLIHSELTRKDSLYTRLENVKVLAGTWNVGQGRATHDSLISWLGSAAVNVEIVVVGLQEVEMGAGFLAMSAAKESMQVDLDGSSVGQWWLEMIGKTLDEGLSFVRLGSRQLAGLLIGVWVRNSIKSHVGDVDAAAVPCGFGRAIGNKGAVALRMKVYGRTVCFVNCHFAAHLEAVGRRNADFDHVYRSMVFSRSTNLLSANAGQSSTIHSPRGANGSGINSVEGRPELSEADMVVFLGDFNYRLHGISYDEARDFISQRCFDWLRERDQLQVEMEAGNVFQGMREAVIRFPPTYKFEKHQDGLAGYDSGEKKRIPAWCDRILYRDSRSSSVSTCCLECPVVSSVLLYEACMDVTDSDHKPVRCLLSVEIARIDESIRRRELGEIIRSNEEVRSILAKYCKVPEAIVSTNHIILQNQDESLLRITNKDGKDKVCFEIVCEGQSTVGNDGQALGHRPRGSFGFPKWLEVSPASGIIKPDHIAEISVHHQEYETLEEFVDGTPQNSWCEDARDKEVILAISMRGFCSSNSRTHKICVRYSFTGKVESLDKKNKSSSHLPSNLLQRSDLQRLSCSPDVVDQLRHLRSP